MSRHKDNVGPIRVGVKYDDLQLERVLSQVRMIGPRLQRIAKNLGMTVGQVAGVKRRYRDQWDQAITVFNSGTKAPASEALPVGEEVVREEDARSLKIRTAGRRIRTVEDLVKHVEVDLTRYELVKFQATKNEQPSRNENTGNIEVTEYFRVWAEFKPKQAGSLENVIEKAVETILNHKERPRQRAQRAEGEVLQQVVIADPHIAKYAWGKSTGHGNWDVDMAVEAVRECAFDLIDAGNEYRYPVAKRVIAVLGDYFHFDTPNGTTTAGTILDRDSRLQNMIEKGTEVLIEIIDYSTRTADTEVILVPGNHDTTLTWALQRILQAHYRDHGGVTIDGNYTTRKYLQWGSTLLGYTHGDKGRKQLPGLMAIEAREAWGTSAYQEFHTGHFHTLAEKAQTIDGVLVRTAPAVCPPDDWHAEHGFVGSLRAMESFFYHSSWGLVGTAVAHPDSI